MRRWFLSLFRKKAIEDQLDAELRFHLEQQTRDYIAAGMNPAEARRKVRLDFGGLDQIKEECRDVRPVRWVEDFGQDLSYAGRMLRKNPGLVAVVVLTLALGIGANTAIFSLVNTVLLRQLPVRDPGRLLVIWANNLEHGWNRVGPSGRDYLDWKERSSSFEDLFLFEHGTGTVTGQGEPEQVAGLRVTTNFGDFLGILPVLGRTFRLEEGRSRHNFAMLSYGYWQRRFGSDPGIVGKAMTLNGDRYTIIGVLPSKMRELFPMDVVVPWDTDWLARADSRLGVFGRLKSGKSMNEALAEMNAIAVGIGRERPERKGWGITMVPLQKVRVEYIRPALLVLLCAVGFVWLIACANVANLMLARSVSRQKEMAIRVALGAGRTRLIRQLLAESTLLALVGGATSLVLALWGMEGLLKVLPSHIPVPGAADEVLLPKVHIDGMAVTFAVVMSLLTGIVSGLIPALQGARHSVSNSLKEGGRGLLAGPGGHRARGMLVIAEAALAFVLVIAAGLMINSFRHLLEANPGFNPDHLLTLQIKLPADAKDSKYRDPLQQAAAFQRFLERVEALPGIRSAGLTQIVPLSQDDMDMWYFVIKDGPPPPPGERFAADFRQVSPNYFRTMGIPLLKGRVFTDRDNADMPRVVIIDESLAHRYFPNQDPVGKSLQITDATRPPREIIGVVGGVRDTGFDQQPRSTIYFPYLQAPAQTMSLVVRTDKPSGVILPAIKSAIWSLDKDQPVFSVRTMDDIISTITSAQRISFILLGVFAFLALDLAAIGIYGVTSYSVIQRTREIGIRMALGARRSDVLKLEVGRGLALAALGVAVGAAVALLLTRFLGGLLYGIRPTDPLTFIGVTLLLMTVAILACYIPARRATKIDPILALRHE